jgi:Cu/Ag efflux protein CusF
MTRQQRERILTGVAVVCLWLLPLLASAQSRGAQSYVFRGRVVSINAAAGTLSVANDNIAGWMPPMTMSYRTDTPDVLKTLKAGDTVTATVYAGDFTTLHNLQVIKAAAGADDLPPIIYVCPTPNEASYVDDKPGKCPVSGVALVATRLVTAYSCLKNQVLIRESPGTCPMDRSDLVPITASLYFTCGNDPRVREMNPGTCSDGTRRIKAFERRAHGDHNPRHGGDAVFMSSDQWHHLEGTFVAPGIFRVYLYDDMARPLSASNLVGRVTMADSNAQETGPSIPLVFGRTADHSTLEARIPGATLPFNLKAFVKFRPNDKEQVFDFTFKAYSREP